MSAARHLLPDASRLPAATAARKRRAAPPGYRVVATGPVVTIHKEVDAMVTAFVLSGGANLGAVQVGMMRALHEAGVRADMLVGASVGAVNAGWLAGADPRDGVDELADIWTSLQRRDVFPVRFGWGLAEA